VGGNADEVGQRLERVQAEVVMDCDWPEYGVIFAISGLMASELWPVS
jgi:hypothetical protein